MIEAISMILCVPFIIAGYIWGWAKDGFNTGMVIYKELGQDS